MTGARLTFGTRSQDILVTLGRDVVDVDFDLVFLAPFIAQFGERVVGTGDPVIPKAERELSLPGHGSDGEPNAFGERQDRITHQESRACQIGRTRRSRHRGNDQVEPLVPVHQSRGQRV